MKTIKIRPLTQVCLIYLSVVVFYIIFVRFFTIPVHVGVDEELYISMAKSFHYTGNFSQGNKILDYSCVLYSMLLSVAYYFYEPESIIFVFRIIGVCTMLTSVFPTYMLSKKVLKDEKKAVIVAVIACFLPSMMNVVYCMQEVLSYPLFLWLVYFVYEEIEKDKLCKISIYTIGIIILSVMGYYTKTYMIFIPIVYSLIITVEMIDKRNREGIFKVLFYVFLYIILFSIGKMTILHINDGVEGVNHYSSQFSRLFPITGETILCVCTCIIVYVVSLCFYWGVLPIVLPLSNWKKHEKKEQKFLLFILASLMILIVEIVVSIVLTEEGNVIYPHKVLYRYFQILEIPILLMFYKKYKDYKIPTYVTYIYGCILGILGIYYISIGNSQRTAIIDAPLFLLMENINRYIIPHFNILVCVGSSVFLMIIYLLRKKGRLKNVLYRFIQVNLGGYNILFNKSYSVAIVYEYNSTRKIDRG